MADPTPGVAAPAASTPAAASVAPKTIAQAPATTVTPTPAVTRPGAAPAATPAPGTVPISALMEEREKRQALQTELESLKTTVTQIQQRQQPIPTAPQQSPDALKAQMDKLWQEDPRKAVQMEIMMASQWSDNVNTQVDGEAEQLSSKYKDFNDYRNTAMRYVRALPLEQRARPGIVEMAYLVTRGQNVDQIIENQRQIMQTQFQQNPAAFQMPAGASAGSTAPTGGPQPTEAQTRAAAAMKVPIAEYMKWVK